MASGPGVEVAAVELHPGEQVARGIPLQRLPRVLHRRSGQLRGHSGMPGIGGVDHEHAVAVVRGGVVGAVPRPCTDPAAARTLQTAEELEVAAEAGRVRAAMRMPIILAVAGAALAASAALSVGGVHTAGVSAADVAVP